jgi:hypothetical protein
MQEVDRHQSVRGGPLLSDVVGLSEVARRSALHSCLMLREASMSSDDQTNTNLDDALRKVDVIKGVSWSIVMSVLVVLDGRPDSVPFASFGQGDLATDPVSGDAFFGLSEFIRTLSVSTSSFTHVAVTKAHRDSDVRGAADIEGYRFDEHDLSVYDVIFLFGVAGPGGTDAPMSDAELVALATFMDGGGGVFATGDHEDLGVELSGRVPRVRSMRKWYYPSPGPHGEPVAPPALGVERIETTQPGHDALVRFDDQSDDIPQPLSLRWYTQGNAFGKLTYPHPLLCAPAGPIQVMPDHMHEGEVIEPWDTEATLSFADQSFVEYPVSEDGVRPLPEIVAWGNVLAETNLSTEPAHVGDPQNVARARSFGVVGAYDGHRAGVGRVAVHSTWHHFFDINLIGDPVAEFPKTEGFNASSEGVAALEAIRAYYRNLVTWLARPTSQRRIFVTAAWYALRVQPLNMLVNTRRRYSQSDLMHIGALAIQSIGRFIPQCALIPLVVGFHEPLVPDPTDLQLVDPRLLVQAALGGAIIALGRERVSLLGMEDEHQLLERVVRVSTDGSAIGLQGLGKQIGDHADRLKCLAEGLVATGGRL